MFREPLAGEAPADSDDSPAGMIQRLAVRFGEFADAIKAFGHRHMQSEQTKIVQQSAGKRLAALDFSGAAGAYGEVLTNHRHRETVMPEHAPIEDHRLGPLLAPGTDDPIEDLKHLNREHGTAQGVEPDKHDRTVDGGDLPRPTPSHAATQLQHLAAQGRVRRDKPDDIPRVGIFGRSQVQQPDRH